MRDEDDFGGNSPGDRTFRELVSAIRTGADSRELLRLSRLLDTERRHAEAALEHVRREIVRVAASNALALQAIAGPWPMSRPVPIGGPIDG